MRIFFPLFCLTSALMPLAAQEPLPPDVQQAFERYTKLPDVLLPVLESITDRASADAAAPKLHELLPQVYDTRSAMQEIKELSPQQAEAVRQKYELAMRKGWGGFYGEVFRLQKANCFGSATLAKEFHLMCMMLK